MQTSIIIGIPPTINRWSERTKQNTRDDQLPIKPVAINALKKLSPENYSLITDEVQSESPYFSQRDIQLDNFIRRSSSLSLYQKGEERSPVTVTSKPVLNEDSPSSNFSARNFHQSQSLPSPNTDSPPLKRAKKTVSFSDTCIVILVPQKEEYKAAGIQLHWEEKDYKEFEESARNEVRQL